MMVAVEKVKVMVMEKVMVKEVVKELVVVVVVVVEKGVQRTEVSKSHFTCH